MKEWKNNIWFKFVLTLFLNQSARHEAIHLKPFRHLFKPIGDLQMLGAGPLALTAADAFAGLPVGLGEVVVIDVLAGETAIDEGQIVIEGEIFGDGNMLGATMQAVSASRTSDGDFLLDYRPGFFDQFQFFPAQGFKVAEGFYVVRKLLVAIHSG